MLPMGFDPSAIYVTSIAQPPTWSFQSCDPIRSAVPWSTLLSVIMQLSLHSEWHRPPLSNSLNLQSHVSHHCLHCQGCQICCNLFPWEPLESRYGRVRSNAGLGIGITCLSAACTERDAHKANRERAFSSCWISSEVRCLLVKWLGKEAR